MTVDGQLALDLFQPAGRSASIQLKAWRWACEFVGDSRDVEDAFGALVDRFGIVEALDRAKVLELSARRGVSLEEVTEFTGLFVERDYHVCWDRKWAYLNGYPMRYVIFIDCWDYGKGTPVFRGRLMTSDG